MRTPSAWPRHGRRGPSGPMTTGVRRSCAGPDSSGAYSPAANAHRVPRNIDSGSIPRDAHPGALSAVGAVVRVRRIPRVAPRVAAVGRTPVDGVGDRVREIEVPGVHDVPADVHLDVDVRRSARIPPRIDGVEEGEPVAVRSLDSA